MSPWGYLFLLVIGSLMCWAGYVHIKYKYWTHWKRSRAERRYNQLQRQYYCEKSRRANQPADNVIVLDSTEYRRVS